MYNFENGYETIILAAGYGNRMFFNKNKIFIKINEKPLIYYSLKIFLNDINCKHIILVYKNFYEKKKILKIIKKYFLNFKCKISFVIGGEKRQTSVYNGLKKMINLNNIIMVHDAARPFIKIKQLKLLYKKALKFGSAVLASPINDTIKYVKNGLIYKNISKKKIWQIQTPQVFFGMNLLAVHELAFKDKYFVTDDTSLFEKYSKSLIYVVFNKYKNIKITTQLDIF